MIVQISTHRIKPGQVERAARRLDANGDLMAKNPGFLFRYRAASKEDPQKLTTVTGWESEEALRNYNEYRKGVQMGADFAGESPYEEVVQEMHVIGRAQVGETSGVQGAS